MKLKVLVAALLLAFALGTAQGRAPAAEEKPNILFIFADDMSWECVHSIGLAEVDTPNLDRLVSRGTAFTRAYNMGSWSGAVCVASRCMLNTGRFLWHADAVYKGAEKERAAGRFWSEHLKKAGYETYMTGKWHVRAPAEKAFNTARNVRGGMPNQTKEGYNRPIEGQPDPWSPYDPKFGGHWKGGKHWSEVVRDDALDYLAAAAKSDKPFFMYLAFNAVHDPRQSPKEYIDKYPLSNVKTPENFMPEYPYKDQIGCGKGLRDEKLAPFPRTEYAVKVNRREYYAILSHMDVQIGKILDGLEKTGKAKNTWIFFTADHGLAVGRHGLLGKQNLYEHSTRVPFIVVGPGVEAGRRIPEPIYLQDAMATTLALAGVKRPDHVEFQNLLPLIRGETKKSVYDAVYGAYLGLQRSVTMDGYKMILYPKVPKALLYNLKEDPFEMKDLAGEKGSDAVMKRLFAKFLELQKQMGDTMDLREVFPGLSK